MLRNVLILHSAALGDFIVTWPLILALSRIHPQSRIIVVTQSGKGALAEAALRVESADIETGWHGLFADGGAVEEKPAKMLAGAHAVFSFVSQPSDRATENLRKLAPLATVATLATKPPAGFDRHASEFLLDQLSSQPIVQSAMQQMINSVRQRGLGFSGEASGDIIIQPGSGSLAKNWPVDRFIELIARLRDSGRKVRAILGEAEVERWPAETIKSLGRFEMPATLVDLLNVMRTASVYIGNDSGPSHLAGMIGLPTLALFGPSDSTTWRPLGPRVNVIHRQPIDSISVDEVFGAVSKMMS